MDQFDELINEIKIRQIDSAKKIQKIHEPTKVSETMTREDINFFLHILETTDGVYSAEDQYLRDDWILRLNVARSMIDEGY
jgi:hypothetical protein